VFELGGFKNCAITPRVKKTNNNGHSEIAITRAVKKMIIGRAQGRGDDMRSGAPSSKRLGLMRARAQP